MQRINLSHASRITVHASRLAHHYQLADYLTQQYSTDGVSMELNYRHWFFISILVLVNVAVFGCLLLAIFGKIWLG